MSVRDEVYDESALALNKEPNACCNGRPFHTRVSWLQTYSLFLCLIILIESRRKPGSFLSCSGFFIYSDILDMLYQGWGTGGHMAACGLFIVNVRTYLAS